MGTPFLATAKPIFEPKRTLKVICVGAGASGLLFAYKLQRNFDNFDLVLYEKNDELSGTWYENKYPGCACDCPAHCYTWSFEPKTDWSANYATSQEIHKYFNDFADKYCLRRYVRTRTQVTGALWNARAAEWEVEITDLASGKKSKQSCHILVNCGGILNAWKYPAIPGLKDYKGRLVHTAGWESDIVLDGKSIGLIGNGSSGVQVLPAIRDAAKSIVHFVREPTWVSPPVGQEYRAYPPEEIEAFRRDPALHLELRKKTEASMNGSFETFHRGSEIGKMSRVIMEGSMREKLHDKKLEDLLIPEWSVGCRRITPGTNYLESLTLDKVEVVYGEIERVTERGCVVEGREYPTEVLVCATGFDTTFKPRFPLIGTTGEKLSDQWKDEPAGYFGVAVNNFPNYFMTLGPNCPIGNGPVLISIEAEVDYIIAMLFKFQKENIRSFEVKADSVSAFNAWKNEFMQSTIWTEDCRSWYKAGSKRGDVAALWPGSTMHYLEAMRDVKFEDWNWEYQPGQNRYSYLGNGHSSSEKRPGGDLAYYIRSGDDSALDVVLKPSAFAEKGVGERVVPNPFAPPQESSKL